MREAWSYIKACFFGFNNVCCANITYLTIHPSFKPAHAQVEMTVQHHSILRKASQKI